MIQEIFAFNLKLKIHTSNWCEFERDVGFYILVNHSVVVKGSDEHPCISRSGIPMHEVCYSINSP